MIKNVIDEIYSSYDHFFDSEKKIAKYIIHHTSEVVNMTVGELSQASGASEASVSRFCKRIGLKGFHHLKISLAQELVETPFTHTVISNRISINDINNSLDSILANKVEELTQTITMMKSNKLHEILDYILKSKHIYFVAVGNTVPVALDGCFKFNQIGISSSTSSILETELGMVLNVSKEDMVIAISDSGESSGVLTAVKEASKRGAVTLSITNSDKSTVALASEYHITTATREKVYLEGYCFSRVSATTVIEILYLFLTTMKEDAHEKSAQHEDLIAGDKI